MASYFLAHRRFAASLTVAVSVLALNAGVASGKAIPAFKSPPRRLAALAFAPPDTVLKRLPASRDELTMHGENAVRAFTVMLGAREAERTTTFQMSLLNAVSLLPERSSVKVNVNGTLLAQVHPASAGKPTLVSLDIPTGVLVAGPNTVQIITAFNHRVDCSIQATYELWAALDPAYTGFLVPRDAVFAVRSGDALALEPLGADGTTRIHLRMAPNPSAADIGQAGRVIDALVRRSGLARPIVDVGPQRGAGAGFDVVVAGPGRTEDAVQGLATTASAGGMSVGRDRVTNRLVVVVTDPDAVLSGQSKPASVGASLETNTFRKTFTELGLPTEVFVGRHYASTIDVNLPADFLPTNDRAQLLLDGSHAATLGGGSEILFRVNGTFVSSISLAAGRSESFEHRTVELPLRYFHPGHNDLSIEGLTSSADDKACDTTTMSRDPRLTIAGTSEVSFPRLVHLATLPQIPTAIAYDAAVEDNAVPLYLLGTDQRSVGSGLTVLANMAATQERIGRPEVHIGVSDQTSTPGIVIGALSDLSPNLSASVGKLIAPVAADPTGSVGAAGFATPADNAAGTPAASAAFPRITRRSEETGSAWDWQGLTAKSMSAVRTLLRDHGFSYAIGERTDPLPPTRGILTIAAVVPHEEAASIGGIALPQITRTGAHWLVVTAADRESLGAALDKLVSSGRWAALSGEAASFDPAQASLRTLQPRTVSYVMPNHFVLGDLRPIVAGAMTDNITLSISVLMALMAILGVSTHLVIRRIGVK